MGPPSVSFPGQELRGEQGSRSLHDVVDPGKVRSNVRVETGPIVMPIGEDAIGFVVADKRIPGIVL